MKLSELAESIARKAHEGQFRRDGVTPYITHPERVVARLQAQGSSDEVLAVGWLHDVGESDAAHPICPLMELPKLGFGTDTCYHVDLLTKGRGETYERYIGRLKDGDETIARTVKIADILDNLSDSPSEKQILKYCKALLFLHGQTP